MTVIDLFAGAGGFGLGFRMAGYDLTLSLEIDLWAAETLADNHPAGAVINGDIRDFRTADIIRQVCPNIPDLIIGGPPCQGFSVAGPAQKDPDDPRNSLFMEYSNWVAALEPRLFVMENVKGLLARKNADGNKVIDIIQNTFGDLGYRTEVWVLNASEYGVPQIRERIFVVGNRLGIETIGPPPRRNNIHLDGGQLALFDDDGQPPSSITVWDAISDLPELCAGEGEEEQPYTRAPETVYQFTMRGNQETLFNHVAMQHSARLVERFRHVEWGQSSADAPKEHGARRRNGNGELSITMYDQNNRRLHPDRPSHTIAASFYANFIHPYQHRNLTAREGARIQSFPDYYRFMGKKTTPSHKLLAREGRHDEKYLCQYNQIGNAVPPLLARAIAEHLREYITL